MLEPKLEGDIAICVQARRATRRDFEIAHPIRRPLTLGEAGDPDPVRHRVTSPAFQ
jgi:hypothetical protein